jgi:hypothetical protein
MTQYKNSQTLSRKTLFCVFLFGLTLSIAMTVPLSTKDATYVHSQAYAQASGGNNTTSSVPASSNNSNIAANQSNVTATMSTQQLDNIMKQLASSDKPDDIATLAYIWGFPLVNVIRTADFTTSPNVPPGPGRGPENTFSHFRDFPNSNFTDVVRPNVDTLYSIAYLDLENGPLKLQIPPIADRYYSLQFIDAYSNNYLYIGSRLNDTTGGTYLMSGPGWQGTVPSEMKQIQTPTNQSVIGVRILVKDSQDVNTVHSIQDQFRISPLTAPVSGESITNSTSSQIGAGSNDSKDVPVAPDPALIPITGIKIYDEIGRDMAKNLPSKNDSAVITKFEIIGIGPGMTPSTQTNETIRQALENGIAEGEKIINARLRVLGADVNGWDIIGMVVNGSNITNDVGNFGTDYLLRAAVAKYGLFANSPVEAVYPGTFTDSQGQNLTGANKYVIHFDKGQTPPVNAFWSLTMYNNASYLADNPINRYAIGDRTPGLVYNEDGSLDIYIQNQSPGPDKESNWLPAPAGDFSLNMRLYNPQDSVLMGEYQYPPLQRVTG